MRIVYICLLGLVFLSLAVFTLMGESLYEIGKPTVVVERATQIDAGTIIPPEALLIDGAEYYVFTVSSVQGYSRRIHTVHRVAVAVESPDNGYGMVLLSTPGGVMPGEAVVVSANGEIYDGCRVLLNTGG